MGMITFHIGLLQLLLKNHDGNNYRHKTMMGMTTFHIGLLQLPS